MKTTIEGPEAELTRESVALNCLRDWVEARDFAGYDPYDALNSPIIAVLSLGTKWGRIAAIQGMKRCPFNLRPPLLARPGHNPKALGLFLEGYARLFRTGVCDARGPMIRLLDLLEASRSTCCSGHGWGYNFDWQSRVFFVPAGTPSIVCTAFIGHALLDAWEALREQRFLDLAAPAADFICQDLNRTYEGETLCFSYTPLDTYAVHNANLLGASLLIRLSDVTGRTPLRDTALSALAYSMKFQREDGSWFYSERVGSRWIDSFHTGFNLESIRRFLVAGHAVNWWTGYEAGREFFARQFFHSNGLPKYFHDRAFPVDIHSAAEAITYLSGEVGYTALAGRVLDWTLSNMYNGAGQFYFQRHRRFVNRIPYMRWSQAWMFRALTAYAIQRDVR